MGDGLVFKGFTGLLDFTAGLVELLTGLGHAGLVLGLFHPLAEFIDVGQHFLFFLAQAFEAFADFFAFGLRLGFLEGVLQFLEAFVEVLLPLGEFLEAVEDLQLFLLFGGFWTFWMKPSHGMDWPTRI